MSEVADAIHNQLSDDERHGIRRGELETKAVELRSNPHAAAAFLDAANDPAGVDATPVALPRPKRRPATLYVFVSDLVLSGAVDGVAPAEGIGPRLLEQVSELLQDREVSVQPVIDLCHTHAVNGYEHPALVKHRTLLRMLGDAFPHSVNVGYRRLDHDHPTPYVPPDRGGPPGQTGDHSDAPLTRHPPSGQDPRSWLRPLPDRARRLPLGDSPRPGPHRHSCRHPEGRAPQD